MRQQSIDFYRGATIAFMIVVNTPGTWSHVFAPLLHAKWHGCTPTDLVFPSFLFIVGVSMWFAFEKFGRRLDAAVARKILKRSGILILLGLLLAYFPFFNKSLETLRFPGVLQRIGLCYGMAAFLCLGLSLRGLLWISGAVLLGFWAVLAFFGTPGQDPFSLEFNAVRHLDRLVFGDAHIYKGEGLPFDPEGLLSTFPAVVTVVLGWFSGKLMSDNRENIGEQIAQLLRWGIVLTLVGLLWHWAFPINKKIWTSSYVLFAGGLSMLFLAGAVWLLDLKKWRRGAGFFLAFGANPLFAYVLSGLLVKTLLNIRTTVNGEEANGYKWLYFNVFREIEPWKFGSLLFALFFVAVVWLVCRWLFVRRVFIKI